MEDIFSHVWRQKKAEERARQEEEKEGATEARAPWEEAACQSPRLDVGDLRPSALQIGGHYTLLQIHVFSSI